MKNYFELLGLEVIDRGSSEFDFEKFKKDLTLRHEEIMVLCASDEHYPMIKEAVPLINTKNRFLAGKYEVDSCKNLFVGQNIFENLQEWLYDEHHARQTSFIAGLDLSNTVFFWCDENLAINMEDFFIKQGLPVHKLVIDFKGEAQPVDNNKTEDGKQRNRRVDFEFI